MLTAAILGSVLATGSFVTTNGTELELDGQSYKFSAANSYSMLYSRAHADEVLARAEALGLNALRMWGFWDGEYTGRPDFARPGMDRFGRVVIQSGPGEYEEEGLRKLDYAIARARAHGIRLIIPLLNEWLEFGGITQYLEWSGTEMPELTGDFYYDEENILKPLRAEFWHSEKSKEIYYNYVSMLMNRVNVYTGIAYKDDPTIMIWEVMNEPRYGPWQDRSTTDLVATDLTAEWLNDAAGHIKSFDSNHLVGTGEEGFVDGNSFNSTDYPWSGGFGEGVDFRKTAVLPNIDVLTFHAWPFNWSVNGLTQYRDNVSQFMVDWIDEHVTIATAANKPLYLGEFGWQILRQEGSDVPHRDVIFKAVYDHALTTNMVGVGYWHITSTDDVEAAVYKGPIEREGARLMQAIADDTMVPHDEEFRFDVFCPADTTCALIQQFSSQFRAGAEAPPDSAEWPCGDSEMLCYGQCTDLKTDPANCGRCGDACVEGSVCRAGSCISDATRVDDGTAAVPGPSRPVAVTTSSAGPACSVGSSVGFGSRNGSTPLTLVVGLGLVGWAWRRDRSGRSKK